MSALAALFRLLGVMSQYIIVDITVNANARYMTHLPKYSEHFSTFVHLTRRLHPNFTFSYAQYI
jgi:hypothetical protein